MRSPLSVSSCWILTEGLVGLKNQAIGLAQALGVSYELKEIPKTPKWWPFSPRFNLSSPWPDLLICCGRQSIPAALMVRRNSHHQTFSVYIQSPMIDIRNFDVVISPEHDQLKGDNVLQTKGAIHQVTAEKLADAASHFKTLFDNLPRPLISVLVGGKNKYQDLTPALAKDLADKLVKAGANTGGSLAVSFSRRTQAQVKAIINDKLQGSSCYIWDGNGENPYFGLLALSDAIVITSDSISMISEAATTGKPIYIYELPKAGKRHQFFVEDMIKSGVARRFSGIVEKWAYTPLNETQRAADFVYDRFSKKGEKSYADLNSSGTS